MKKRNIMILTGLLCLCVFSACQKNVVPESSNLQEPQQTQQEQTENKENTEEKEDTPESEPLTLSLPDYEFTRENLPKMDGSTSLVPLGKALVSALLGETEEKAEELVSFHKTTQSYRNLMNGDCELVLGSWPNEAVFDEMKEARFDCQMEEISTEALIFVVNENNPVDNLTTQQIQDIYSGKITNWSEVGGNDEAIDAFQRNSGSGSQALMEKLVMQDITMAKAPESYMIGSMGELMEAVKNYDNSATALGYSVYYYANDMKMAEGLKIISVDGVEPNADTIRQKKYPHTNAYYCAIDGASKQDSAQRIIYDWLASEEGQKLVASQGYVSIMDTGIAGKESALVTNRYTRKTKEFIPRLVADNTYGQIYPFVGEVLYSSHEGGYSYTASKKYGFIDETGCIIADPTYTDCAPLHYNDTMEHQLPFWLLEQEKENANPEEGARVYGLASFDGTYVLDCTYDMIYPGGDGILLREDWEKPEFILLDYQGKEILTSKDISVQSKDFYIEMSDGEGILSVYDGEDNYYYMNLKGEKLFDKNFSYAAPFAYGKAVVADGEEYGIIDDKGNIVVPLEYEWASVSDDNYLYASKDNYEYLFDANGKEIERSMGNSYFFTDIDGNYCRMTESMDEEPVDFCSSDGKTVYSFIPNKEEQLGVQPIFAETKGNTITVRNKKTGQEEVFDGYDGISPVTSSGMDGFSGYIPDFPYFSLYRFGRDKEGDHEVLIDKDLKQVFETEGSISYVQDFANHTTYFLVYEYETQKYRLYTENFEPICLSESIPIVCKDRIMIYNEYCSSCIDLDGKIEFTYAFTGSLGD